MLISQKGSGVFSIMVPFRRFLVYTQMLEMTPLKPCFVDFVLPFIHITPGFLLSTLDQHSLTGLTVTLTLPGMAS